MKPEFWHQRWETKNIGFHGNQPNPLLVENFSKLKLAEGKRVFLPLCGKTLDIHWLLEQGFRVVGSELNETAVRELFGELAKEPEIKETAHHKKYSAGNLDVYVGDLFELKEDKLGIVDAIYDRAALVALPAEMRKRYTSHLIHITGAAPQLLLTFEYNQKKMDGPPFSVDTNEVYTHYEVAYSIQLIERKHMNGKLKGTVSSNESVWLLS